MNRRGDRRGVGCFEVCRHERRYAVLTHPLDA